MVIIKGSPGDLCMEPCSESSLKGWILPESHVGAPNPTAGLARYPRAEVEEDGTMI